jgi:hypothetical protein
MTEDFERGLRDRTARRCLSILAEAINQPLVRDSYIAWATGYSYGRLDMLLMLDLGMDPILRQRICNEMGFLSGDYRWRHHD